MFELVEKKKYELIWSFVLDYENSRNPYLERQTHIKLISDLCSEKIAPNEDIRLRANEIITKSNAKNRDALHLASAIWANAKYFITCDDKLIKTISSNEVALQNIIKGMELYNPIDFLRREMNIDVIE